MVRRIMHGCNGRMGQMITGIVDRDDEIRIVAGVDINDKQLNDYPVFKSINDVNVEADVVVDFGATAAIDNLLSWCKDKTNWQNCQGSTTQFSYYSKKKLLQIKDSRTPFEHRLC